MVNPLLFRWSWTALQRFSQWLFVLPCTSMSSLKQIVPTSPLRVFSVVRWNIPDAFFIPSGSLSNLKRPSIVLMTQTTCFIQLKWRWWVNLGMKLWSFQLVKKCFHVWKRVVFSDDLIVYMNFEIWSKTKRSVILPLQYDWRSIHDTSLIDWGNDSLCLKFRQFNLDPGFHGKLNFPSATKKNRFCVRLQSDNVFNPFNDRLESIEGQCKISANFLLR